MKCWKIQRKIRGRCKTIILFKTGVDYLYQYQNLLQYSKENKKMPTDDIKVEYDAFFCHTRSCVYRIFIRFVEFDLGLSLHGLLSPLHRYCAPTLTGIKDSYGCVPFPVYCIIGLQQPPHSQLSTFRYSYL